MAEYRVTIKEIWNCHVMIDADSPEDVQLRRLLMVKVNSITRSTIVRMRILIIGRLKS